MPVSVSGLVSHELVFLCEISSLQAWKLMIADHHPHFILGIFLVVLAFRVISVLGCLDCLQTVQATRNDDEVFELIAWKEVLGL